MTFRHFMSYAVLPLCMILFAFGLAAGQEKVTKDEVRTEVGQAAEKAKAYASQQVEIYRQEMQANLDGLAKRIDEMKERAKAATGDAATKYQTAIAELQSKMDATRRKLKDLGSAGSGAWNEMKTNFDKAMSDLNKAFQEAVGQFK
jgi:hypothetical protein